MDLTFNVLESIRRDMRELSEDLRAEKTTRQREVEEIQKSVKDIRRPPYLTQPPQHPNEGLGMQVSA
jgi:hypothetical protein